MALWAPLAAFAMKSLTPYGSSLLYGGAVLATSVLLFVPALMRWPGRKSDASMYLALPWHEHGYGLAGGAIWAIGTTANLISGAKLGNALSYAIGQAAPMVATLWGLLWYREFAGATNGTIALICAQFALFVGAVACIAMSK